MKIKKTLLGCSLLLVVAFCTNSYAEYGKMFVMNNSGVPVSFRVIQGQFMPTLPTSPMARKKHSTYLFQKDSTVDKQWWSGHYSFVQFDILGKRGGSCIVKIKSTGSQAYPSLKVIVGKRMSEDSDYYCDLAKINNLTVLLQIKRQ